MNVLSNPRPVNQHFRGFEVCFVGLCQVGHAVQSHLTFWDFAEVSVSVRDIFESFSAIFADFTRFVGLFVIFGRFWPHFPCTKFVGNVIGLV